MDHAHKFPGQNQQGGFDLDNFIFYFWASPWDNGTNMHHIFIKSLSKYNNQLSHGTTPGLSFGLTFIDFHTLFLSAVKVVKAAQSNSVCADLSDPLLSLTQCAQTCLIQCSFPSYMLFISTF